MVAWKIPQRPVKMYIPEGTAISDIDDNPDAKISKHYRFQGPVSFELRHNLVTNSKNGPVWATTKELDLDYRDSVYLQDDDYSQMADVLETPADIHVYVGIGLFMTIFGSAFIWLIGLAILSIFMHWDSHLPLWILPIPGFLFSLAIFIIDWRKRQIGYAMKYREVEYLFLGPRRKRRQLLEIVRRLEFS